MDKHGLSDAIVADSSCDLTDELATELNVVTVPFTMTLEERSYSDDNELDLPSFMRAMKATTGRIGSAAPSPYLFKQAFERTAARFAITLSSKLSACHENAVLGAEMADVPVHEKPHIFDSMSASAGEVLVALKIRQLLREGLHHMEVVQRVEAFIASMKTYFVLENVDNLLKNGRLNKVAGKLTSLLNIKPILGSDGQGAIKLFGFSRNQNKAIAKMAALVVESGKSTEDESLVVTHCGNQALAERVVAAITQKSRFREALILPTRGLSSVYTDEQGVVMAF
jgi:DegV family protein with EDD domain